MDDEVKRVVQEFADGIQSILGGQFVGMYLYGSLALGDFDRNTSDIDFLVVTDGEISAATFAALGGMHAQLAHSGSPWANKIEAAYIPRDALNHTGPSSASYPQIEKGTHLFRAPLEIGWVFQQWTLRERGVIVTGPAPRLLVDPVDPANMRRAAGAIMGGWLEQSRSDPDWIAWARGPSNLAFIVLTLCRLLYSLETGSVASKPASALWATQNLGPGWAALIESLLASHPDPQIGPNSNEEEMLAFLVYAIERSRLNT